MNYQNYNWQVIAGDYNSPFIRNYIWTSAFAMQAKLFDLPQVILGISADGNNIKYIGDLETWKSCHFALREKIENNHKYFFKLVKDQLDFGKKFTKWTEKKIYNTDLKKLSAEKIVSLYKEFIQKQAEFYARGTLLVFLDFQGFSFVEGNLEKFLRSKLSESEYNEVFSVFTEPVKLSFSLAQELALLRIMSNFYDDENWRTAIKLNDWKTIKKDQPKFSRILEKHAEHYGWVFFVYAGPVYGVGDFCNLIKDYLLAGVDPKKKIEEIKKYQKEMKSLKKDWLKKLKPDKFYRLIIKAAGWLVWTKPRRKDLQSLAYWHLEKIQKEIGRRLFLSLAQVRSMSIEMIESGLGGEKIDLDEVNKILRYHVCVPNINSTVSILIGNEAKVFIDKNIECADTEIDESICEIKGTSAFPGIVKGKIKLINLPEEMTKMEYGDVLVSTATSPNIISAIKKASAIVTNEGGLTCHAAIVSREFKIPCVVGTKIATHVFKDGDIVEVDADSGIIKKL